MSKAEMTAEQQLAAMADSIADVRATYYRKGAHEERKRCAAICRDVQANFGSRSAGICAERIEERMKR